MTISTIKYFPLAGIENWILWKLEPVNGRLSKIPFSARYNGKASTADRSSWTDFHRAKDLLERSSSFNGLGFVFSKEDGLVFIDIDHCIEDGEISETGRDILSHFQNSYIEVSQSGTGIHIITRGTIPKAMKNSQNGVEIYCDRRYCAVTGNALAAKEPHEEQSAIDYVWETYRKKEPSQRYEHPATAPTLRESEIIQKASKDSKFSELYSGNWEPYFTSHSEADLSLCNALAFWCDCDPAMMDSIFRSSGLYRGKWNRADYRNKTIDTAVGNCRETYSQYVLRKRKEEHDELFRQYTGSQL